MPCLSPNKSVCSLVGSQRRLFKAVAVICLLLSVERLTGIAVFTAKTFCTEYDFQKSIWDFLLVCLFLSASCS